MADTEPKPTPVEEQEAPAAPARDIAAVATVTGEENDEVVFEMRAKLFRFVKDESEWKERGTGEARLLKSKSSGITRLLMRRDQTLKVCANHILTSDMKLTPNVGSDRSWVWNAAADFADGEAKSELLAIRFANSENAGLFKTAFEEAQASNAKAGGAEESKEEAKEESKEEAKEEAKDDKPAEEAKADEPAETKAE